MSPYRINLGGEGEVRGVLNQQGRWVFAGAGGPAGEVRPSDDWSTPGATS
jgi:hypothetical protein